MTDDNKSTDGSATNTGKIELTYNKHLEHLISSEAEKALILYWLHDRSEQRYSRFNTFIALPVIVMSTLAGTASIGQDSLFSGSAVAPIIIGGISILVGILNTVSSFFGWAKRSEGHRISGVNYSKLHRWIAIELALPRDQRVPAKIFLKEIRGQIDRLNETSPSIPPQILTLFKKTLKDKPADVSLPDVCDAVHSVSVYPEEEEAPASIVINEESRPADISGNSIKISVSGIKPTMRRALV